MGPIVEFPDLGVVSACRAQDTALRPAPGCRGRVRRRASQEGQKVRCRANRRGTVPLYRLPTKTDAKPPPPDLTEDLEEGPAGPAADAAEEVSSHPSVCSSTPPTDLAGVGEESCAEPASAAEVPAPTRGERDEAAPDEAAPASPDDAAAAAARAVLARIAGFVRGDQGDNKDGLVGDNDSQGGVEDDAAAMAARALLARMRMRKSERGLWCDLPAEGLATRKRRCTKDGAPRRSVKFDLSRNSAYEITPYSEIYGLHPREFVFGRNFRVVPAGGDYGFVDLLSASRGRAADDSDGESESDIDSDSDDEGHEQGDANAKVELRLQDCL